MDIESVQRSVRWWAARVLTVSSGDPEVWTLKDERSQIDDEERPVAVVERSTPLSGDAPGLSIPQRDIRKRTTFSIQCYPPTVDDDGELLTPPVAAFEARKLVALFDAAIDRGLTEDDPEEVSLCGPGEIPLFDFTGVGVFQPGPEDPVSALLVESATVRDIPDPLDDVRFTVVCEVRVSWWQHGRVRLLPTAGPIATDVPFEFEVG